MSGRSTPIAKGYVDDTWRMVLALIVMITLVLASFIALQNSYIRDLQRRVGQIENKEKR